ncbi:hypothetical protein NE237_000456 [Protea cynaroides]|uniref:Uncharacterized protein n=1 Tax=Protea cynaroides TaxID=273540 RepID=A0A9Q0KRI5_9MAGN|nr:hypothetical protein NE237_000456 [Protea cynaroides]
MDLIALASKSNFINRSYYLFFHSIIGSYMLVFLDASSKAHRTSRTLKFHNVEEIHGIFVNEIVHHSCCKKDGTPVDMNSKEKDGMEEMSKELNKLLEETERKNTKLSTLIKKFYNGVGVGQTESLRHHGDISGMGRQSGRNRGWSNARCQTRQILFYPLISGTKCRIRMLPYTGPPFIQRELVACLGFYC